LTDFYLLNLCSIRTIHIFSKKDWTSAQRVQGKLQITLGNSQQI